ncbi:uncharacterized protein FN964_013236 [Alca torda]
MKLLLLLLLCLAGLAPADGNLFQFGSMIKHKTGKWPLSYNGYGCYCGSGGSKQPLDATDWCCHAHDCCYKRISSSFCHPKLVKYNYYIQGGQITCGKRQHGVKSPNGKAQPSSSWGRGTSLPRWPLGHPDTSNSTWGAVYAVGTVQKTSPASRSLRLTPDPPHFLPGPGTSCERQSCICDKQAAECFQRTARTYQDRYKNYPNFLCKGRTPSC